MNASDWGANGSTKSRGCDALRLFAARARRVRKDFRLDAGTTPHALRICELVQGLPLGLELATFVRANASQQRHVRERAAALLADLGGSSCVTSQDNRAERLEGLVAALLAPPT